MKKTSYKLYPGVEMGEKADIGDFVVIGVPPRGAKAGELKTIIGSNAVIRSHSVIYAGNVIGDDFQTGHRVTIRENNKIGSKVSIGTGSVVEHHISIEDGVRLHAQVFLPEYSVLKEGCWLGPNVVVTNALHPLCPKVKECLAKFGGVLIGAKAKIGANVTLLPGIKIGRGAFVGAGAVVVKDVPPGVVVVGNPARVIKKVSELKCPYGLVARPYE